MSSFNKSQTKKTKRKTKATAEKMTIMTTKTTATRSECALIYFSGSRMKREHFVKVVDEALDSPPPKNFAVAFVTLVFW
jgi:hypothetical protein